MSLSDTLESRRTLLHGRECTSIAATRCAQLQVPIRVVYLDNSGAVPTDGSLEVPCDAHNFAPGEGQVDVSNMPNVTVLYRPGHYDILYEA